MAMPFNVRLTNDDDVQTVEVDAGDARDAMAFAEALNPGWSATAASCLVRLFTLTLVNKTTGETRPLQISARDVGDAKRLAELRLGAGWEMQRAHEA